jgi:hypothetical protein
MPFRNSEADWQKCSSRPFRRGQVNYAVGLAGIEPFKNYKGKRGLFGQTLKVENIAVVDEIAAVAKLLMRQAKEARPAVIFRGLENFVALRDNGNIEGLSKMAYEKQSLGTRACFPLLFCLQSAVHSDFFSGLQKRRSRLKNHA